MNRDTSKLANGHSTPEYATVLLEICGIKETWTKDGLEWKSSVHEIRENLEFVVDLIKQRTGKNVLDNIEARKAIKNVWDFIEKMQNQ